MLCHRLAALAGDKQRPDDGLTTRERQAADLIIEGRSNKEIAIDLRIGPATVKNHVHDILDKLKVRRRAAIGSRLRRDIDDSGLRAAARQLQDGWRGQDSQPVFLGAKSLILLT